MHVRIRRKRLDRPCVARSRRCCLPGLARCAGRGVGARVARGDTVSNWRDDCTPRRMNMSWIDQRPDDAMDGAFMAVAPEPFSSIDPPAFREAMALLGAAVHVVTSAGVGGKTGFTATAVCSVS